MKTRLVTYDDVEYGDIFTRVGFGYAPIGTIIYRDGNTVPNGFLLCDGSTKSISSYPDLATYFQTTHGSKNYYGGNGSSTFGLPSIRRMPGNVSDELSTTEKVVGISTTNKPLYQKIIVDTMPSAVSTTKLYSLGATIDYGYILYSHCNTSGTINPIAIGADNNFVYFGKTAIFTNSATNTANRNKVAVITTQNNWLNNPVYICTRYTKTSDSTVPAGYSPDRNGIWCIKATTDPTN